MKYYIISGEASGDLHGSNLVKAIQQKDQQATFRGWGGNLMMEAGVDLVKHYKDLAFMGLIEVLKNIRTIRANLEFCKNDIAAYNPDALILIDYSGFNLRIAKWAHDYSFKKLYYISPQVWAWRSKRVFKIKKYIDHMMVILPFEQAFYAKYNYPVTFVGHPLLDVVDGHRVNPTFRAQHDLSDRPIIALLPGSRKQEIKNMLSIMLDTLSRFPDFQFVIAGAPSIEGAYYQSIIEPYGALPVKVVANQTYDLLRHAHAALVTSGTATLETALFKVPQVVCYKGNRISYWIVKNMVNIKYIALVNLIADKALVKELIQFELTPDNLEKELTLILQGPNREKMLHAYENLRDLLGNHGAPLRAATKIQEVLALPKA